ncbi:MAG: hypothetical protein ACP5N1_06960 [Candidatus Woesearchaeota archaeon]
MDYDINKNEKNVKGMSRDEITHNKTIVLYNIKEPYQSGVTFIAINTSTNPPILFATYFTSNKKYLPELPKEMIIVSKDQAKKLFDFRQGSLSDLV